MARKQKEPEVWVIRLDGLRVDKASTLEEAKRKAKALEKTLPVYMNFDFSFEKQQSTHITTA